MPTATGLGTGSKLHIEHVTIEDRATVLAAMDAFGAGLDLADALHVCRSERARSSHSIAGSPSGPAGPPSPDRWNS